MPARIPNVSSSFQIATSACVTEHRRRMRGFGTGVQGRVGICDRARVTAPL